MIRLKIVYIVSDIQKSLGLEWVVAHLMKRFDLHFIIIGKNISSLTKYLDENQIPHDDLTDQEYPSFISKLFKIYKLLKKLRPSVVHCHLWSANLLGLTAAAIARIEKRIFTRHHGMIHYKELKKGRKLDIYCNLLATHIVAISENVKEILLKYDKASPEKIRLIHHGFDLSYFKALNEAERSELKSRYGLSGKSPVIGVIARYVNWKGIQFIIPAFKTLLIRYPQAHLVLANASGPDESFIKQLLKELPENTFTEIAFDENLNTLYNLLDVFVHAPIDNNSEAFGQTYVESLASGVPSVFTMSGVAKEFIVHEKNALVVPYRNSKSIHDSIVRILTDPVLNRKLIEYGKKSATLFPLGKMAHSLELLYNEK